MKDNTENYKRTTAFYESTKPHRRKPVIPPKIATHKPGKYIRVFGVCNPVLMADFEGVKKKTTQ